MALHFSIPESQKTDRAYWGLPLWYRIYERIFYAFGAFICVGGFFDVYTPAPIWLQLTLAISSAVAVLLFRVAYPNGFSEVWDWIMEGMQQAAEETEKNGKTPNVSSREIAQARAKAKGQKTSTKERKR